MKSVMLFLASAVLATAVAAQTQANSQTSVSAQSNTSVSASQSGAHTSSTNSIGASQDTNATNRNSGSQSGSAVASGSASNQAQAGVDTSAAALPSGITIPAVLSKSLDSKKNKQGDEVTARTAADVLSQGRVIIPRNTKLIGHVTEAKAKSSGESESALGIAFDRAILKNGQSLPLNATIQALAAPMASASSTINDDAYPSAPRSSGGGSAGGGGLLGGTTGAVGSVAGGATSTVGGVANGTADVAGTAASTVDATTRSTTRIGSNTTASLAGSLNSGTTGVIGLKDLQLASNSSSSTNGSLITSTGKNVKLDGGSQMILRVGGSAENSARH